MVKNLDDLLRRCLSYKRYNDEEYIPSNWKKYISSVYEIICDKDEVFFSKYTIYKGLQRKNKAIFT
jgi:NADH:ubiquinone oxidoreductase subunit